MSRFRAQVAAAVDAVAIHPSGSASWCGRRLRRVPRGLPPEAARAYVVAVVQEALYARFYCRGAPTPHATEAPPHPDDAFVDRLSAANAGDGCWKGGWRVDGRRGGAVVLVRNGLQVVVEPPQVRADGAAAQVRMPKELRYASPGHYTALGNSDLPAGNAGLLRLYLHVAAAEAAALVRALTTSLNDLGAAFRLKVVDTPQAFDRCDSAVLYVRAADFAILRPVLRDVERSAALLEPTPAFTKPLAPGIGLAEHPGSGESFGSHRCRLLAEGIVEAHAAGLAPADRPAVVEARFAAHGLRLDAPYLEPGSRDRYALETRVPAFDSATAGT